MEKENFSLLVCYVRSLHTNAKFSVEPLICKTHIADTHPHPKSYLLHRFYVFKKLVL
jgi:hypothetical protein